VVVMGRGSGIGRAMGGRAHRLYVVTHEQALLQTKA
jgi:hypothetical protein